MKFRMKKKKRKRVYLYKGPLLWAEKTNKYGEDGNNYIISIRNYLPLYVCISDREKIHILGISIFLK